MRTKKLNWLVDDEQRQETAAGSGQRRPQWTENDGKQLHVGNKKGKDPLSVITPQPTVVSNSPGSAISSNIRHWEQQKRAVDNDERCFGASH